MKIKLKHSIATLALSLACSSATAADGIKVEHLGPSNTLVRIDGDAHYLMMPVQEDYDDATVNLLLDGKLEKTFYVRLAKTAIDYAVPFDLEPYRGHDIVLDIVMPHNRYDIHTGYRDDACWKGLSLADTFDTTNVEKYRPAYHHTPQYGWMNDPNGMFYKDGEWHLYYQWNPYGSKWQNMTWGHSSSTDLVNWKHHPAAIEPNGLGSVFSGSSVIDHDNTAGLGKDAVVALYTSAGASQVQSLAHSIDNGMTFEIYPGNPVITLESEARDPNMFWNQETNEWNMILAHPIDHEMLIFTSSDLKEWTLQSNFGRGLGAQDGVWECPDLFELPVNGTDMKKWMLVCNINPGGPFGGSGIQYFIGDFDGKTFKVDTDSAGKVPTKWLDYGKDNYALVSWSDAPDNRRTTIGWMSNWQYADRVPTMQFRSANTLPRDIELFMDSDGEICAASVPAPELDALRGQRTLNVKAASISSSGKTYKLPKENDGICEITLDIIPCNASDVALTFSNSQGENVVMTYDPALATLSFDRRNSGVVDFSDEFPDITVAPTHNANGKDISLRIFIDRSSMEVFANGGRGVMTNLVFPTEPYSTLTINSKDGNAKIKSLNIYSINTSK